MKNKILFFLLLSVLTAFADKPWITCAGSSGYVGDSIITFCLAKLLSLKYNIPFYYFPFKHSEIFAFSEMEQSAPFMPDHLLKIRVGNENDIVQHIHKENVVFYTDITTHVGNINEKLLQQLKSLLQFKNSNNLKSIVNPLPLNKITVAMHIRKGNGGGEHYDGEQTSLQLFDFDRSMVSYLPPYNYPFDWESYIRSPREIDKVDAWQNKFPPEQYYIDQLLKISKETSNAPLFVQIFTDDKNPLALIERIQKAANNPNIVFHFENNRHLSHGERIEQDLFSMSRFDVLIRSQSYFARAVELIGNFKVVLYPLKFKWLNNKLIMTTIILKGSIPNLKQ